MMSQIIPETEEDEDALLAFYEHWNTASVALERTSYIPWESEATAGARVTPPPTAMAIILQFANHIHDWDDFDAIIAVIKARRARLAMGALVERMVER